MTHYLRKALVLFSLSLALFVLGCSCGKSSDNFSCDQCTSTQLCCDVDGIAGECLLPPPGLTSPMGFDCYPAVELDAQCGFVCNDPPPLDPGPLAEYMDSIQLSDGTLLIAGYSAGVSDSAYGDLVVATVADASMRTANFDLTEGDWEIVDGFDPSAPVTNPPTGWRGGISEPGDDVGRFASIAANAAEDTVYVSYYDKTNGALKVAVLNVAAGTWSVTTVDDAADAGHHTSIALLSNGQPAVAYGAIVPAAMGDSNPTSEVRVIAATDAAAGTWGAATVVATRDISCRIDDCGGTDVCFVNGECGDPASPPSVCTVDPITMMNVCTPSEPLAPGFVEPSPPRPMTGLFNGLAVDTGGKLALIYYDRTEGNLYAAESTNNGAGFTTPFAVDGYDGPTNHDCGLAADLTVDGTTWHIAYVDGIAEELLYRSCSDYNSCGTIRLVDDGVRDEPSLVGDGGVDQVKHIVGDDASIQVSGSEIRIAYQDATALEAVMSVSSNAGAAWTTAILDATDGAGFWTSQTLSGAGESYTASLYRNADAEATGTRVLVGTAPAAP